MIDALLDFRFGWRWLLPLQECSNVRLCGFDAQEERFLRAEFAGSFPSEECGLPEGLICNAECSQPLGLESCQLAQAGLVCIVATRRNARRWRRLLKEALPHVREYALLPAKNPRVVVPLSCPRHACTGLDLHRPGRWSARIAVAFARLLARRGMYGLLRGKVLLLATRQPARPFEFAKIVAGPARCDVQDYAVYLGTPEAGRKTVVLPLACRRPDTLLKVADSSASRTAVSKEAEALTVLRDSPLADNVPKLLRIAETRGTLTLWQEYRSRRKCTHEQHEDAMLQFLKLLSSLGRKKESLSSFLDALPELENGKSSTVAYAYGALRQRLALLADSGVSVAVHRNHGDLAPWNCMWTDRGLFVYDWEESRATALAFGDAIYYVVAPALHIHYKAKAGKTLDRAMRLMRLVAARCGMDDVDIHVYIALWLLMRSKSPEVIGEMMVSLERRWP